MGTAVKKPGRREAEAIRRRQYIVGTATRLFSERGFHEVSMQEIARESEIAIATLYKMFSSKEDLYAALMEDLMSEMAVDVERALEAPVSNRARLENVALVKSHFLCQHISTVRLFLKDLRVGGICPTQNLILKVREKIEMHAKKLAEVFRAGIEAGEFAAHDPVVYAMGFIGLSEAALMLTSEDSERYPAEETTRAMLEIFFNEVGLKK